MKICNFSQSFEQGRRPCSEVSSPACDHLTHVPDLLKVQFIWVEKILSCSRMHITVQQTQRVGSKPIHVIQYVTLGCKRQKMGNVWFGIKEGSEPPGCILYLSSFSSEYTWSLLNGANAHWVTPGQPSNTLFKSHNTQAQDLWTRMAALCLRRMIYRHNYMSDNLCLNFHNIYRGMGPYGLYYIVYAPPPLTK